MAEFKSEHFESPKHAIETGWLHGYLISQGVHAFPVTVKNEVTDEHDFTPDLVIEVPLNEYGGSRRIRVRVMP